MYKWNHRRKRNMHNWNLFPTSCVEFSLLATPYTDLLVAQAVSLFRRTAMYHPLAMPPVNWKNGRLHLRFNRGQTDFLRLLQCRFTNMMVKSRARITKRKIRETRTATEISTSVSKSVFRKSPKRSKCSTQM
jgi:hypothetical protein